MTFSGSMGLPLWREGIVGNISCLLATTPSSHTCPSLHCEEVLYSTVTSCTTPECTFQTNVNTCSCVSSVGLCYWMSVMPVNTCITDRPLPCGLYVSFLPTTVQSAWDSYVVAEITEMDGKSQSTAGSLLPGGLGLPSCRQRQWFRWIWKHYIE